MRSVFVIIALLALVACHKESKPAPSKRAKREEAMVQASREQQATDRFAIALREVIEWRQIEPKADNTALVARLEKISTAGLPDDLAKSWRQLFDAVKTNDPDAPALLKAVEAVNTSLTTHGFIDLRL